MFQGNVILAAALIAEDQRREAARRAKRAAMPAAPASSSRSPLTRLGAWLDARRFTPSEAGAALTAPIEDAR